MMNKLMLLLIPLCCDLSFIPDIVRWSLVVVLILALISTCIWFGYELWKDRKED